jgi:AcrR family transcriptional regulator
MPQTPGYPLETIERARHMYRDGARVREIAAATGMSVGALYYHLDGHALPGLAPPRLPRRREVEGNAALPMPSRGRQKLAVRLFRAAERQARKLERSLAWDFQRKEDRALDLAALRELTRILRDLSVLEDSFAFGRAGRRERGGVSGSVSVEHEQALAVEGRAVLVSRMRSG